MRKLKILWKILDTVGMGKIITSFMSAFIVIAFIIPLIEPNINGFGNGLWYCFSAVTTIGFGDLTAVTTMGRVLTGILAVFGILIIAMIPGILVNYFTEITKLKTNESLMVFFDKMEQLDTLSKEELREISSKIKRMRNQV